MASQSTRRQLMWSAAAGLAAAQQPRRPNLIYVFADQLRRQSCGYAGDELAYTPNIDRLAHQSLDVQNAISSTPVCAPYRASLLTGKYQSSTGMVINELRLSPKHQCLGQVLTRGGYQTAYIGKWHLWANQLGHHEQTRNGFVPPGPYRLGFDGLWAAYNFNHTYVNAPYFRDRPKREIYGQYEPEAQTDLAIRFMKQRNTHSPFALFLSWGPPHDPWQEQNQPPDFRERFRNVKFPLSPSYSDTPDPHADNWAMPPKDYSQNIQQFQRGYYAMTSAVDAALGRLIEAIRSEGLENDTILVFTSDHGEMFGAHGRRAKYIFYEEAARVPFLVRWPGHVQNGRCNALLSTPDIMPTLLSMMNLPVPRGVEGTDLSGVLLGRSQRGPGSAYMQGMGATAAWDDGSEWRALRDHEFTYATYRSDQSELLFNNASDPFQLHNLAADRSHGATLTHFRRQLRQWMKDHNDQFQPCSWYRDRWSADRNITNTATGVKQDLAQLKQIVERTDSEIRKEESG